MGLRKPVQNPARHEENRHQSSHGFGYLRRGRGWISGAVKGLLARGWLPLEGRGFPIISPFRALKLVHLAMPTLKPSRSYPPQRIATRRPPRHSPSVLSIAESCMVRSMPALQPSEPDCSGFARRANHDGSFDSICRQCFVTVHTSHREAELDRAERDHLCAPEELERLAHYKKPVRSEI